MTVETLPDLSRNEIKDLRVLAQFTSVYCRAHQHPGKGFLAANIPGLEVENYPVCDACRDFLDYAIERRLRCPLDPRPVCKHCHVHCYKEEYRRKVREIMRFSGQYLLKRGRIDLLWHYFF